MNVGLGVVNGQPLTGTDKWADILKTKWSDILKTKWSDILKTY